MPTTKTKKPASNTSNNGKGKSKSGNSQKTTIKHSNGASKGKQPLDRSATIQKTTATTTATTTTTPRKEEINKASMVVLDNKKNKKKQNTTVVPVYLGYPDSQVDQNDASVDAFQSYIGGYPIWFDDTQIPEQRIINCGGCGNPMYLLVQVYAPLDHRPHERVIYVWGCNRRQCMRKPHSIRALRVVQMNQSYAKQLTAASNKHKRGNTVQQPTKSSTSVPVNMSSSSSSSMGFGMSTTNTGVFSLGNLWNNDEGGADLFNTTTESSVQVDATDTLLEQFDNMSLDTKQGIKHKKLDVHYEWPVNLPAFKHYWLDIEAESLEQSCLEKLKEKYAKYMDLQAMEELAMTNSTDQESNEWESEQYEKSWKPKGFDKAFKRFTEIVQENPEQCIRYQWKGQPLFYTHQDEVASLLHSSSSSSAIPSCPVCGATRIFELQLMPSLLSALATSTYRHANDQRHNHDPAAMMDSLDMGMEWGTIFVFTCENDCFSADTLADCSSIEDGAIRFHEELVLLQHEL